MPPLARYIAFLTTLALASAQSCPDYLDYALEPHGPYSGGRYNLSYQRPRPECRTIQIGDVDAETEIIKGKIADPDLRQLFGNAYRTHWILLSSRRPPPPPILPSLHNFQSTIADRQRQDIEAMWLRDSANQMQSYLPNLVPSTKNNSLASLYRGVINLQARYLLNSPYCNSFQPPVESGIPPANNTSASDDTVVPPYNNQSVFECKYELDSLAAFLEICTNYWQSTNDTSFFGKYSWISALEAVLDVADAMRTPTYAANGSVLVSPYAFTRETTRATETLANDGIGNPVQNGTGLIRSAFRPSDDATIYQLFIPANMMCARYLATAADIVDALGSYDVLCKRMRDMSYELRQAITKHGIVNVPGHGQVYAYEIDGYGSQNLMDDANIPSLLSAPFLGYLDRNDSVYQNTRSLILSAQNSYFMRGPVISAVGGPHNGPGYAWPMASIVRIFTSDDDEEILGQLGMILSSTDGLGLIHESVNSFKGSDWTRQWFSWANGLFGQCIIDLSNRKPEILKASFQ
ncbi:hypothetical protein B0A48_11774 [Cryoendolithus antarcticus]|uniref:Meiotically up-regulated gene 157 protein n=1 Tax=Cryoendolithus antarcticus TaxID=1507870 RepID=A0A1V8ST33_9PEZI|nr:hypothetical protein B0A48_11774 [Cryoendolithus antarcticus]